MLNDVEMKKFSLETIEKSLKKVLFDKELRDTFPKVSSTYKKIVFNDVMRELNRSLNEK